MHIPTYPNGLVVFLKLGLRKYTYCNLPSQKYGRVRIFHLAGMRQG